MDIGVKNRNKFGGITYGGYAGPIMEDYSDLCVTQAILRLNLDYGNRIRPPASSPGLNWLGLRL